MSLIEANLQHVRGQIAAASLGDRAAPTLVAVSKTRSVAEIRAALAHGQRDFGENYVQEGVEKVIALAGSGVIWHFIGPLQSNKAKLVAEHFDWVHGLDRLKIADALSRQRQPGKPLNVCIQVNVSGESSKGGVAPEAALALAESVAALPNLRLRGVMTIIENISDVAVQRDQFGRLRAVLLAILQAGIAVDTCSMGMSQDFITAIEEGSTMVRIGSAIFGARV